MLKSIKALFSRKKKELKITCSEHKVNVGKLYVTVYLKNGIVFDTIVKGSAFDDSVSRDGTRIWKGKTRKANVHCFEMYDEGAIFAINEWAVTTVNKRVKHYVTVKRMSINEEG